MFKHILGAILAVAALFAAGCRTTDYYQHRAVLDAREYLLKHSPELSASEVAFVKFNEPALLFQKIGDGGSVENTFFSGNLSQICITWVIPTRRPVYMVFGVSTGSMVEWKPERLIRKIFEPLDRNRFNAINAARAYAQNTLFHTLSVAAYNHLRAADPEIVATDFEPAPVADGTTLDGQTQTSLVWRIPGQAETAVVITGYGSETLGSWRVNMGGERPVSELDAHTVKATEAPKKASLSEIAEPTLAPSLDAPAEPAASAKPAEPAKTDAAQ